MHGWDPTVIRSLRYLAKGASGNAQELETSNFIVIYSNINRTHTMYSTESPTCNKLVSGTASTLYAVDGDLAAVDPAVIKTARRS